MLKEEIEERKEGIGLAMSGGGFRATLFHLGSLMRLNELGWLNRLSEITSVSGGSIVSAYLGYCWKNLSFNSSGRATNFGKVIVDPLRTFCLNTIDVGSIIRGILIPFRHPSSFIEAKYRKLLFGNSTLQDLPKNGEGPRFTIYATSLQTGVSVRFSQPYLGDYKIGRIDNPDFMLAKAVTASTAFPPVLCPVKFNINPESWKPWKLSNDQSLFKKDKLRSKVLLADGGIYDNLGLERIWDRYTTVLVSDAGAPFRILEDSIKIRFSQVSRTLRTLSIITEQTRALRKRILIESYKNNEMSGTYWGIATQIGNYKLEGNGHQSPLVIDSEITNSMSKIRTRLNSFKKGEQESLINWGYALTDAAMRRHVLAEEPETGQLPYPNQQL